MVTVGYLSIWLTISKVTNGYSWLSWLPMVTAGCQWLQLGTPETGTL